MRYLILFALACGSREGATRGPTTASFDAVPPDAAAAVAPEPAPDTPDAPVDAAVDSARSRVDRAVPPVVVGRVVAVEPASTGSIITVAIGKDKGIATHSRAALLDEDNRRIEVLQIISVTTRTCRLRSKQTTDFVRKHPRVAFEP